MLGIRDLVVGYHQKNVLYGATLDVGKAEIMALVGHKGAGKTTLIRVALGLITCSAGSVVFDGLAAAPVRVVQPAGKLYGGQQQMVALASVRGPRLTMLDEPSTGLSSVLVDKVFKRVVEMHERFGISMRIVDRNACHWLGIVDRVAVLKGGRTVFDGRPARIQPDDPLCQSFQGR